VAGFVLIFFIGFEDLDYTIERDNQLDSSISVQLHQIDYMKSERSMSKLNAHIRTQSTYFHRFPVPLRLSLKLAAACLSSTVVQGIYWSADA
jgi:hypothetical protein